MILGFLSISWRVRQHHLLKHWTPRASQSVNGCEDPVQMRQALSSFSRFSTRDSYIALCCAMKDEPAFKPLEGNPTFCRDRASQYPLYLRQQTQKPSHIPIAEGRVLLRCLWKFGLLLQLNPGNPISSLDDMACMELSSSSCDEIGVPLDWRRVYQGISVVA